MLKIHVMKNMTARNSMFFHAPDKRANQEVNFDVISNVMTLFKFGQSVVLKELFKDILCT